MRFDHLTINPYYLLWGLFLCFDLAILLYLFPCLAQTRLVMSEGAKMRFCCSRPSRLFGVFCSAPLLVAGGWLLAHEDYGGLLPLCFGAVLLLYLAGPGEVFIDGERRVCTFRYGRIGCPQRTCSFDELAGIYASGSSVAIKFKFEDGSLPLDSLGSSAEAQALAESVSTAIGMPIIRYQSFKTWANR